VLVTVARGDVAVTGGGGRGLVSTAPVTGARGGEVAGGADWGLLPVVFGCVGVGERTDWDWLCMALGGKAEVVEEISRGGRPLGLVLVELRDEEGAFWAWG